MQYVIFTIIAQAAYSASDVMRKLIMHGRPFDFGLLRSVPFLFSFVIAIAGFVLQLYVLRNFELSKTIIILATTAIILSALLGMIFFNEKISIYGWIGVVLAVAAIVFTHIK